MERILNRLSNGEEVDLSKMSVEELQKLHFDEEVIFCKKALSMAPFSVEREILLKQAYEFVGEIIDEISKRKNIAMKSNGSTDKSIKLLKKLIANKVKERASLSYFEAGVGSGYAIGKVLSFIESKYTGVKFSIKGCDIYTHSELQVLTKNAPNIEIQEGHILSCLRKVPDDSIDLFYADNVFEHFMPDEAEEIFFEMSKKLKDGAYVYLVIPNKYVGPFDVSRGFLPFGSKALGTHFMEMSFNEVNDAMAKCGIYQSHCYFTIPKTGLIFCLKSRILIKIKLMIESFIAKIPIKILRRFAFILGGYSVSVLKKGSQ